MSKKLINDPERVVDESLTGLVSVNSGLKLLEGHRVVLRADVQDIVKQGKVNNYFLSTVVHHITLPVGEINEPWPNIIDFAQHLTKLHIKSY